MFNFDNMITPKILILLYWLATLACIFMVLYSGSTNLFHSVAWLVAAVLIRIPFELVMIAFKNNEYLRRICDAAEAKKGE
ncbi:DUF4282 domain-containing protein [Citrobacter freundii complex sp. 2024EL-00228]|uniref:DUF4282 domain-containing protein n=1 Tax=unclassified Citrobacter freundii complex TaxID=2816438 RepID=UPI00307D44A7